MWPKSIRTCQLFDDLSICQLFDDLRTYQQYNSEGQLKQELVDLKTLIVLLSATYHPFVIYIRMTLKLNFECP